MTAAAMRGPEVHVENGWGQGRATYGGLIAALVLARIRGRLTDPGLPLRSASVSFVAPVAPGSVVIDAQILRGGSSVTQAQGTLRQGGHVAAVVLASFGTTRASSLVVDPSVGHRRPQIPAAESLPSIPF